MPYLLLLILELSNPISLLAASLNDAQIVEIVVTANDEEIADSRLALQSDSNSVQSLAQKMLHDHSASNREIHALALSAAIQPEASDSSSAGRKEALTQETHLKTLHGTEFDRAYLHHLVLDHQDVLKNLDTVLIPGASNPKLKSLLVATRSLVAQHLKMAERIQASQQP